MSEYETGSQFMMSEDELRRADRETQLEVMECWFRARFEDPAHRTPYESAEGGYIYIWGGPYDACDELESEFGGVVPNDVIKKLIDKLEGECIEWAPTPSSDDYENYLVDDIGHITEYYQNFADAIRNIKKLLETEIDRSVEAVFYRMLFVNTITALETYLSDAFITTVVNAPKLMRRFIETTPEFRLEKIAISEVFQEVERIEQKAKSYLIDVVWHHLRRIRPMYQDTLGIKFPDEMGPLFKAILVRHDIVHRNGKTRSNEEVLVTCDQITDLLSQVETFAQYIDQQVASVKEGVAIDQQKSRL